MSWLFAIIAIVAALVTWSLIAVRMINDAKERADRQSDQRHATSELPEPDAQTRQRSGTREQHRGEA